MDHPRRASRDPLEGAEGRGSGPACAGLDGPKAPRLWRGGGPQDTPAARQSRFRGVPRWGLGAGCVLAGLAAVPVQALAQAQEDGLSLNAAYRIQRDDNLFRLPEGADPRLVLGSDDAAETVHVRSVGLRFAHDYGLQRVEADLGLVDYAYDRYRQLDLLARNHDLRWRWAFTPRVTGTLRTQRDESVNSFDDASVLSTGNRRVRRYDGLDMRWQLDGAWSLVADAQSVRNSNQQPLVGEESSSIRSGAIGLRRDTPKGSSAALRYRSGSGETLDPTPGTALLRDDAFSQDQWQLDLRWVASAHTSLDIGLSTIERGHRTVAVRDFDATNARIGLNWTPTVKTLLRTSWSRDTGSYQTDNASIARTERWTWLAQWAATSKLALIAQGGTARRRYLQPPPGQAPDTRRDRTQDLSLTLRWTPTLHTSLDIGWQHTRRNSTDASARFSSDALSISAAASF